MQKKVLLLVFGAMWLCSLNAAEVFRNTGLTEALPVSGTQKKDFAVAKLEFTGENFPKYLHIYRHRRTAPGMVSYDNGALRINAPAGVRLEYENFRVSRRAMQKMLTVTLNGSGKGEIEFRIRQFNAAGKFVKTTSGGTVKFDGKSSVEFTLDPASLDAATVSVGPIFVVTGDIELTGISGVASAAAPAVAAPAVPAVHKMAEKLTLNSDFTDCLQADEAMRSALIKRKVTLKSALFPEKWTLVPHGGAGTVEFIPGEPAVLKISCPRGVRLMAAAYRIRTPRLQKGFLAEVAASGNGKVESRLICLNQAGKFIRTIRAAEAMEFNGSNQVRQSVIPAAELPEGAYAVIPLFILTGDLEILSVSGGSVK